MKEKINLLSRGIFEYQKPDIVVSEEVIHIEAEAGAAYTGFFDVNSVNGQPVRAMVFSSNKHMICKDQAIVGTSCRVNYTFDPGKAEAGEVMEGHFSIISNAGEIEVPFSVTICRPFCVTAIGKIRDLSQFSELAKTNWHEAAKLFRSQEFPRVFLVNKKYAHIYENLIRSRNTSQAMEEFLCTLKRKQPIHIRIAQDEIYHEDVRDVVSERLVIEKDTWGYKRITVKTVGSFLQVAKKELTTEDFLGSYYELEYRIYPEAFGPGNNYGKIIISCFDETIEIPVSCIQDRGSTQRSIRRSVRGSVYEILENYLLLQMGKIPEDTWIRKTREAVNCCRNNSDAMIYELAEAHFSILAGEETNAHELLDHKNEREIRYQSVIYYYYYLYLTALLRKDEEYNRFVFEKLEADYNRQYDDWQLLWLILQMTDKISAAKRYVLIREQFQKGCISPLMYWEAVKALNEEPSLLRELTAFEIQMMYWAVSADCAAEDVRYQFCEICIRSRSYSALALKTLLRLYEMYPDREVLLAICSMLIKGNQTHSRYHIWFQRGIEASLKLTNIYEYFMYSLDEHEEQELPLGVLIYFNYDNRLSVGRKAYLYAYVVNHKDSLTRIYRDYENIMKSFTYEQLRKGYISRNMAVLYHQFVTQERMSGRMAGLMPNILFKYEISCETPGMRGVIVSHREVCGETYYPLADGLAFVDLYMDEYQLIFVDRDENRYLGSVSYKLRRLMDDPGLARECYRMDPGQPKILLNRSERAMKYHMMDEVSIDIYKRVLKLPNVRDEYQKNILKNLIDFYYDNYEGETLEKYLLRLDISLMDSKERGRIIEYYIQRGLYEKAMDAIKIYGSENIQDKRLMRLSSRMIRSGDFAKDQLLIDMAYCAFAAGKYDDAILEYLIRYYLGATKELYAIWKAAQDFEVPAFELEEKLLCQILFTESYEENGLWVFASYYKKKPDPKLVRAVLVFYCSRYLIREKDVDARLFDYVEIELGQLEQAYDVCALALLKYYASEEKALSGHEEWVCAHLGGFLERGIVLPFFSKFVHVANLPEELLDKVYVQYCTNPKNTVTICYELHEIGQPAGKYVVEDMSNVYGGIFVKSFIVYANEEIRYTIQEKNQYGQVVTDGQTLSLTASQTEKPRHAMSWINTMLTQAHDDAEGELLTSMERFESLRYTSRKLFKLISGEVES